MTKVIPSSTALRYALYLVFLFGPLIYLPLNRGLFPTQAVATIGACAVFALYLIRLTRGEIRWIPVREHMAVLLLAAAGGTIVFVSAGGSNKDAFALLAIALGVFVMCSDLAYDVDIAGLNKLFPTNRFWRNVLLAVQIAAAVSLAVLVKMHAQAVPVLLTLFPLVFIPCVNVGNVREEKALHVQLNYPLVRLHLIGHGMLALKALGVELVLPGLVRTAFVFLVVITAIIACYHIILWWWA